MKYLIPVFFLTLLFSGACFGKQRYSVVVNGYANHLSDSYTKKTVHVEYNRCNSTHSECVLVNYDITYQDKDKDLNENNLGTGISYDLNSHFLTIGTYTDSFGSPEVYAGLGKWLPLVRRNGFELSYGGTVLAMTHSKANDGNPILAPVPALTVGYKRFHVNMAYTPRIDKSTPALLFFQSEIEIE